VGNDLIYFIISLVASSIGSLLGIGGGIIIVPTLLSIGITKELAAVSSSLTVFVMAVFSSCTYMKRKQGNFKIAFMVALGSIPGSYLGVYLNRIVFPELFNILFGCLILLLLVLMLIKNKLPRMELGKVSKVLFGLFIGVLSGFFGIGGGPITIPILLVFFALQQRVASATSSYITLITAFTSVISNAVSGNNDVSLALYMIPGAVIGAQVGTFFNKKVSEKSLTIVFNLLLVYLFIKQVS
jgi:uncharacterized membrane protein YfcA